MVKAVAINGSPRMGKGYTGLVLESFLQGMKQEGAEIITYFPSRMKIKPCTCGRMHCWNEEPEQCCIHDDMDSVYPELKAADILILATPVYIPLPGDMQNFLNRICPLLNPQLVIRDGRTRARFHDDVNIRKIVLVATSGWWEVGNMNIVLEIVKELAENASVEFAGAILRPHSSLLRSKGEITKEGKEILEGVKKAGSEVVIHGAMTDETLQAIRRQLISHDQYL